MDRLIHQDLPTSAVPEGLVIELMRQDPQSFGLGLAHLVRNYTFQYLSTKGDILGGLSASQYGLVAVQARSVLEKGIDIYIGWRLGMEPNEWHRVGMLEQACETEETAQAGRVLLLANPIHDQEVLEYANACFEYVENTLGLQPPLTSMGHGTKEERAQYDSDSLEIARFNRYLGIVSPYSGSRFDEHLKLEESTALH